MIFSRIKTLCNFMCTITDCYYQFGNYQHKAITICNLVLNSHEYKCMFMPLFETRNYQHKTITICNLLNFEKLYTEKFMFVLNFNVAPCFQLKKFVFLYNIQQHQKLVQFCVHYYQWRFVTANLVIISIKLSLFVICF